MLSIFAFLVAVLLGGVNISVKYKLAEDTLVTAQMALLHIAALVYTYDFFAKERFFGIFILPLSAGLSRFEYIAVQFLTLFLSITMMTVIFFLIDSCLFYFLENTLLHGMNWQLLLYGLSATLLAFVMLLLGRLVSMMNALIYSVVVFFVGSGSDELLLYSQGLGGSDLLLAVASFVYYCFPNFAFFDWQSQISAGMSIPLWDAVIFPLLYMLCATVTLFLFAWIRFEKQALRV